MGGLQLLWSGGPATRGSSRKSGIHGELEEGLVSIRLSKGLGGEAGSETPILVLEHPAVKGQSGF